jgi:hypothetical protein
MKYWAIIACSAIGAIAIITGIALSMGHDNLLVTGAVSAIVGISAGVAAYLKGKSTGAKGS